MGGACRRFIFRIFSALFILLLGDLLSILSRHAGPSDVSCLVSHAGRLVHTRCCSLAMPSYIFAGSISTPFINYLFARDYLSRESDLALWQPFLCGWHVMLLNCLTP